MINRLFNSQIAIIDRLTPEAAVADPEDRAKARLVVGIIIYGSLAAVIMALVRLSTAGWVPATYIVFGLVPIFMSFLLLMWSTKSLSLSADLMIVVIAAELLWIAYSDGGLSSRVLVWMPAEPLLASFVGYRIGAFRISVILGVGLAVLLWMHKQGSLHYVGVDGPLSGRMIATIGSMLFVSIVCYQYASARRRAVMEYQAMEVERRNWLAMVTHELRTPLTAIYGAFTLLHKEMEPTANSLNYNLVGIGKRNAERMVRLVNDILDAERLQTGELVINREELSVNDMVEEACLFCEKLALEKNICIQRQPSADIKLLADGDRLTQVMLNLLTNAIKFNAPGERVRVGVTENDKEVIISVRDYGPGIAEEFGKLIFGRFAQASSGETRHPGGSGLGLYISKGIVEAHGGQLSFTNDDVGCSFYVHLPKSPQGSHQDKPT